MGSITLIDITPIQLSIMVFVKEWANEQKTPIPRQEIIRHMTIKKVKNCSILNAINSLVTKGYIRRAYSEQTNHTKYVMIRNI